MTDFENKPINRNVTKEKFEAIRDHKYGTSEDTFKGIYTYGHVASWLTWNRDKNGCIVRDFISEDRPLEIQKRIRDYINAGDFDGDGYIENWTVDIAKKLTTDIVFLAENMSLNGRPVKGDPLFANAHGNRRIVKTFFGTEAEGAYFTDIIKSDQRIIDRVGTMSDGKAVKDDVLAHPEILKEHIRLFKEELDFIGAEKPLLIIFGTEESGATYKLFMKGTDEKFRKERFRAVVPVDHYASYPAGHDLGYIHIISRKLKDYLTIPTEEETLKEKWQKLGIPDDPVKLEEKPKETKAPKQKTEKTTKKVSTQEEEPRPDLAKLLNAFNSDATGKSFEMRFNNPKGFIVSRHGGQNNSIGIYITSNTKGVKFSWQTVYRMEDYGRLEKSVPSIKKLYTNKTVKCDVTDAATKVWIEVDQENPAKDCLEIAKATKELVGYY